MSDPVNCLAVMSSISWLTERHSSLVVSGKKFKEGAVCGTGLSDSVSEHFYVPEVIPKVTSK